MVPLRPDSSRTAPSSARMAGGEPSYPTTRYRSPAGGAVAFIAAKAIRFPAAPSQYPASGRHDGLAHPSWRTYQPVRNPLAASWPRGGGTALVVRAATHMAKLKLVMNTLAFTFWKPASSQPSAAATEEPAAATARTRLHKWRSALGTGTDARAQDQQIIGDLFDSTWGAWE